MTIRPRSHGLSTTPEELDALAALPQPLSVADVRVRNVVRVARALMVNGPSTRADLGALTGLTRPTVRVAVGQLESDGWLVRSEQRVDGGGRPAELLEFNRAAAAVAAVRDRGHHLELRLADVTGSVVAETTVAGPGRPDQLGATLADGLHELQHSAPGVGPLGAVTVLEPGLISRGGRVTVTHRPRRWREVPVVELVQAHLPGVAVSVLGPAAAALIGEPSLSTAEDAVFVLVDRGLVLSARVGGVVVAGSSGAAGEFGHVIVEPHGRRCACGRNGCLETVASGRAILTGARELGVTVPSAGLTVAGLQALGRPDVDELLAGAAARLGAALAWVASVYDPEVMVLGGTDFLTGAEAFVQAVQDAADRSRSRVSRSRIEFRLSTPDADLAGGIRHSLASLPEPLRQIVAA